MRVALRGRWLEGRGDLYEVLEAFMPDADDGLPAARTADGYRGGSSEFHFQEEEALDRFVYAPRPSGVPFHLYVKPSSYRRRTIRPLLEEPRAMRPVAGAYLPGEHWMLDAVISDLERGKIPFALFLDRRGICVYRRS